MITMRKFFQRPAVVLREQALVDVGLPANAPVSLLLPQQAAVERQFVDLLLDRVGCSQDTECDSVSGNWHAHFDNLLESAAARGHVTPYFPSVLPRLMRLLREQDCPAQAVTELVASDATLAGNVLRLANSPMLRTSQQTLDSLQKATALLGFQGMYALVAASVMEPVILRQSRQYPRLAQRLWRHSLCTAHLLQVTGDTDSEGRGTAYLAGLLHGIGTTIVCNEVQRQADLLDKGSNQDALFYVLIQSYASLLTQKRMTGNSPAASTIICRQKQAVPAVCVCSGRAWR